MSLNLQEQALRDLMRTVAVTGELFLDGMHRSWRGGSGTEYKEHHHYTSGEDIRSIDWKKFASSDKLLVKRFNQDKLSSWSIVLDSSQSMLFGKKSEWLQVFVGSLVWLFRQWNDSWMICGESMSFEEAMVLLSKFPEVSLPVAKQISRSKGRVIIVSDFFDDPSQWRQNLKNLESPHKFFGVQIYDLLEKSFDFKGLTEFSDLESDDRQILRVERVTENYKKEFLRHQKDISSLFEQDGFFVEFEADLTKIINQLRIFFEVV